MAQRRVAQGDPLLPEGAHCPWGEAPESHQPAATGDDAYVGGAVDAYADDAAAVDAAAAAVAAAAVAQRCW